MLKAKKRNRVPGQSEHLDQVNTYHDPTAGTKKPSPQ